MGLEINGIPVKGLRVTGSGGTGGPDLSSATATPEDILQGKTAFTGAGKITGTYTPESGVTDKSADLLVDNPFDAFTFVSGTKLTADVTNNRPGTTIISVDGWVKTISRNLNTVFSGKKYLWFSFSGNMDNISSKRASFVDFTDSTIGFDSSANCPTVTLVHKTADIYTLTIDSPISDAFSADIMYELSATATVN